jgi:hypothetical protein
MRIPINSGAFGSDLRRQDPTFSKWRIIKLVVTQQSGKVQSALRCHDVIVAAFVPREPKLFIRPETLQERKPIGLVKPQSISNMVPVVVTLDALKCTAKRACEYVSVIVACLVARSLLDVLSNHVHKLHARFDGKPKHDHLGVSERMVKAD